MGGFQHGGSFVVPGSGGPDSQLVAFRATPGERVDVSRRGEGGGRPVQVNQTVNFSVSAIDGRDAARFVREQKGQIASVVAEASRESQGFRHRVLTGQ